MAAQRFLNSLVNDAHAAATDAAQDSVLAQLVRHRIDSFAPFVTTTMRAARGGVELFEQQQCWKQVSNLGGKFGMRLGVLIDRGPLAATHPLGELVR